MADETKRAAGRGGPFTHEPFFERAQGGGQPQQSGAGQPVFGGFEAFGDIMQQFFQRLQEIAQQPDQFETFITELAQGAIAPRLEDLQPSADFFQQRLQANAGGGGGQPAAAAQPAQATPAFQTPPAAPVRQAPQIPQLPFASSTGAQFPNFDIGALSGGRRG
jgi:hypothetical protein